MRHWIYALTPIPFILFVMFFASQPGERVSGDDAGDMIAVSALPLVVSRADQVNRAITETTYIDICSQHAQICPIDGDTWQGEPDAWQYTAKKWQRHTHTPSGINVMWESSFPYSGPNPDYADHRENHYADYTNTPDEYPVITGTTPIVYDWERWAPVGDMYRLHQFGKGTESLSPFVGDTDCESGLIFPLIDHNVSFNYTPMYYTRRGVCVGNSYIATQRVEMWGEPLSPLRISRCDNNATGIPADQSSIGNTICKLSPHVALAYTRCAYGAGPEPEDTELVGCEATVYAWGWPKPQQASITGQDYEIWFRNGLLRFSKWLNLTDQVSEIPAPDDDAWWNPQCQRAWSEITNWVYTGRYRIGLAVYTDTISLPTSFTFTIPTSGGSFVSTLDNTSYIFPPNTFTETVIVTHTIRSQDEVSLTSISEAATMPSVEDLIGINHYFDLTAVYSSTRQPAYPTQPYTITVQYTDVEKGAAIESTLALYHQDGSRWVIEPTSEVFTTTNMIVAIPNHLSRWAVLGETRQVFLPLVAR
jgi:hypothetical protein